MGVRPWRKLDTPWHRRLWFDMLTLVDPKRAVVSWHHERMDSDPDYRDAAHLGMRLMGQKRAAYSGPTTTTWPGGLNTSADAETLGDMPETVRRARISRREDPVGSGLIRQFVQGTVGEGIIDKPATGDSKKDAAIKSVWDRLNPNLFPAENLSWPGAQRLLMTSTFVDGEIWCKRSPRLHGGSSPTSFEAVERDRVRTPADARGHMADPKGRVIEGVEKDRDGVVRAFWIAKRHPGDAAVPGNILGASPVTPALSTKDFVRVPPSEAKQLGLSDRPGQTHGLPLLTVVLQNLRDLDLLLEAAVKRLQIAACLAVFLETTEAVTDVFEATKKEFHYQLDQDLVPGMIFVLRPGEKVSTISPDFPIPDLDVLTKVLARRIGAAVGVSWRVVLADLGEANFSAARADRIESEEAYVVPRQRLVEVLAWVRLSTLEEALLTGDAVLRAAGVTSDDLARVVWIPPKKPWLDPKAGAEAAATAINEGLLSKRDYFASQGKDWEEELAQQILEEVKEKDLREAANLGGEDAEQPIFAYHLTNAVVTINDVRDRLGLEPVPGGDVTAPEMLSSLGVDSSGSSTTSQGDDGRSLIELLTRELAQKAVA